MEEQTQFLISKGLKAIYLGASDADLDGLKKGKYNYIFVSPETIMSAEVRKMFTSDLFRQHLAYVFIDESHCILKW